MASLSLAAKDLKKLAAKLLHDLKSAEEFPGEEGIEALASAARDLNDCLHRLIVWERSSLMSLPGANGPGGGLTPVGEGPVLAALPGEETIVSLPGSDRSSPADDVIHGLLGELAGLEVVCRDADIAVPTSELKFSAKAQEAWPKFAGTPQAARFLIELIRRLDALLFDYGLLPGAEALKDAAVRIARELARAMPATTSGAEVFPRLGEDLDALRARRDDLVAEVQTREIASSKPAGAFITVAKRGLIGPNGSVLEAAEAFVSSGQTSATALLLRKVSTDLIVDKTQKVPRAQRAPVLADVVKASRDLRVGAVVDEAAVLRAIGQAVQKANVDHLYDPLLEKLKERHAQVKGEAPAK